MALFPLPRHSPPLDMSTGSSNLFIHDERYSDPSSIFLTRTMSVHLVILIHGLYGSPANLTVVAEEVAKAAATSHNGGNDFETVVHICRSFTGSHTWDGIDVNAKRASHEIDEIIERLENQGKRVDKFSIMGYSLGGCKFNSWSPCQTSSEDSLNLPNHNVYSLLQQWSPDTLSVYSTLAHPHSSERTGRHLSPRLLRLTLAF